MKSIIRYNNFCCLTIISVCLIIAAGGFVRMSGAGMGCPDWPKCFGKWIPPTHVSQLPQNYKEIYSDRGYDELDYNLFNTWAEYINRLIGLVGGICCFILFILSIMTLKPRLISLSLILLLLMGFQAWMGALVVYSILAPFKITIHMLIALIIISLLFFLFRSTSSTAKYKNGFVRFLIMGLFISVFQIILGTQVRELVDTLSNLFNRDEIVSQLPMVFEIHRTIAWLVIISNTIIIYKHRNTFSNETEQLVIILTILALLFSGILMSYFSIPGVAQLIHLLGAVALFICQLSMILKRFNCSKLVFP